MLFHGWCTKLTTEQVFSPCPMCGIRDGDTFNHLSKCRLTQALFRYYKIVPEGAEYSCLYFYGCHKQYEDLNKLYVCSFILNGIYNATNKWRNLPCSGGKPLALLGWVDNAAVGVGSCFFRKWRSLHGIGQAEDTQFVALLPSP